VGGLLLLRAGEISSTICIPTRSDTVAEGASELLSLAFEQVLPTASTKEMHFAIRPSRPVLLSDFEFDGTNLRFRGDADAHDELSFQLLKRDDGAQPLAAVSSGRIREITLKSHQQSDPAAAARSQVNVDLNVFEALQLMAPSQVTTTPLAPPLVVNGVSIPVAITGTIQRDRIKGNRLNNLINGLEQRDRLTGGKGADYFQYDARSGIGKKFADVITDFSHRQGDTIALSADLIAPGATLRLEVFSSEKGRTLPARLAASDAVLLYNRRSGDLYLNRNGTAAGLGGGGGLLATLEGEGHPLLRTSDLVILEPLNAI
jgi:hypothetical protein